MVFLNIAHAVPKRVSSLYPMNQCLALFNHCTVVVIANENAIYLLTIGYKIFSNKV